MSNETKPQIIPLLISMRALAAMAGVSTQLVKSRALAGELRATAYTTTGGLLFKPSDAKKLHRKPTKRQKLPTPTKTQNT